MERATEAFLALMAGVLACALLWTTFDLPDVDGIGPLVDLKLGESGVESSLTAVLLNFRAYDTLLEIGVLLLAVTATRSLHPGERPSPAATEPLGSGPVSSPLLDWFAPRLVPLAIVVAGYFWWAGGSMPGGAFQGGTVLGAALSLLLLAGRTGAPDPARLRSRVWLASGFLVFLAIGIAPALIGMMPLRLPPGYAGWVIIGLEAALTVSIGACLVALVVGVPSRRPERPKRRSH